MKASARFGTGWSAWAIHTAHPARQTRRTQRVSAVPQVSAEQVEAAMRTLAFASARLGNRTPLATADLLSRPLLSADHAIITNPVGTALAYMEVTLGTLLIRIAGHERATAARDRINVELFDTFDRPRIEMAGPTQ